LNPLVKVTRIKVTYARAFCAVWPARAVELNEGGRMSLNVKTRKVDGIVVVDMSGRLTIGEPVLLLRETLRVHVNDGARQFVLNLGDVSYIDSSGLGELVSAYTTVRNKQGDVKLLNLTAKAKDLLQMTKLLTVFDVYDDEGKAIEALKGSKTSA
jgi:anti-sigma B factor antagonist